MEKSLVGAFVVLALATAACGEPASEENVESVTQGIGGVGSGCLQVPGGGGIGGVPPQITVLRNGTPLANGQVYAGTIDTVLEEAAPDTNQRALPYVTMKGGTNVRRGLLQFDVTSISSLTTIHSACLVLYIEDSSPSTYPAYELLANWNETQATWNHPTNSTAWAAPGGWSDRGVLAGYLPVNTKGKVSIGLDTDMVQRWIQFPDQNHGVIISHNSSGNGITFTSANSKNASIRPALLIW